MKLTDYLLICCVTDKSFGFMFHLPWFNASNSLEHIFSNGFSQGLQWVREKNPTAFPNASNALEQMFSTAFLYTFNG